MHFHDLNLSYGNIRIDKALRSNNEILLLRPDKGSGVVVMNKSNYIAKFDILLSDGSKFQKDKKQTDASEKTTKTLSVLLNKLKSQGIISPDEHRRLLPTGAIPPRLYGLPKTHKDGVPIRPIVSMTRSPYEPVSKWLSSLLKPIEGL